MNTQSSVFIALCIQIHYRVIVKNINKNEYMRKNAGFVLNIHYKYKEVSHQRICNEYLWCVFVTDTYMDTLIHF